MQDENEDGLLDFSGELGQTKKAMLQIHEILKCVTIKDGTAEFKAPITPEGNRDSFYLAAHLTRDSIYLLLKKSREVLEKELEKEDITMNDISMMSRTINNLTSTLTSLYDMTSKALSDVDHEKVKKPTPKQVKLLKQYLPSYEHLMDDEFDEDDMENHLQDMINKSKKERKERKEIIGE